MPKATRGDGPDVPGDPIGEWMTDVTVLMERLTGRADAQDKTIERLAVEVRGATKASEAAANALERIARVEEAKEAREQKREKERFRWADRLWSSTTIQLLLAGIVVAFLQVLGTAWVAHYYLPIPPSGP